jgi:uncharacterized membrane protein YccC
MRIFQKLSAADFVNSISMAIACLIAYWVNTSLLIAIVGRGDDLLGGMWAAVAAAFVFRDTRQSSLSAGTARLIATSVSFALCLTFLWLFPPSAVGMGILLAAGALVMIALDRRGDVITTAITTAVVMVVAILNPAAAAHQPVLRLFDTIVGISIGVSCKWIASLLFYRVVRPAER